MKFTGAYIENGYGVMTVSADERLTIYKKRLADLENSIKNSKATLDVVMNMKDLKLYYEDKIKELEEFMN